MSMNMLTCSDANIRYIINYSNTTQPNIIPNIRLSLTRYVRNISLTCLSRFAISFIVVPTQSTLDLSTDFVTAKYFVYRYTKIN